MNMLAAESESGIRAHSYDQEAQDSESPGFTYLIDKTILLILNFLPRSGIF